MKAAAIVALAAILTPSVALAADLPFRLAHPRTGAPGMWLDLETSRDALAALEIRPTLERRIELLEDELELRTAALEEAKALHLDAEASAVRLADALERESSARSALQLELLEARRERWTWGAVGAGGGVVLVLILLVVAQ